MPNTITVALDAILAGSIPLTPDAIPNFKTFSTIVPIIAPPTPGEKIRVPVVSVAQAVQVDPTSYENSGDTILAPEATATHLSAQFGLDSNAANAGAILPMLFQTHVSALQAKAWQTVCGLLAVANYGAAAVTVSSAAYALANFQTLFGAVPGRTALVLGTAYHAKTPATFFPPGTEGVLQEASQFSTADENVAGFVARPECMVIGHAFPFPGAPREVVSKTITLPCGLDAQVAYWFQRGGRQLRCSIDLIIAPVVGQAGALKLIKSA